MRKMVQNLADIETAKRFLYETCPNVEEEVVNQENRECYIFFSSNGLYKEDSPDEFQKSMIEGKRYEWKSIVTSLKKKKGIGKVIYVRDIYKNFYIYGISRAIDTIDKVVEYLKNLTEGYSITTVGISSGGYMATVVGCSLKAKRVFCISGQFDLTNRLSETDTEVFLKNNRKYFSIVELIEKNEEVPIYYFCPINCGHDYDSYTKVKDIKNVRCFLFPDKVHAATVYPFNFPDLLYLTNERLDKLQRKYAGKLIDKREFLFRTMTFSGWREFLRRFVKSRMNIENLKSLWDVKR